MWRCNFPKKAPGLLANDSEPEKWLRVRMTLDPSKRRDSCEARSGQYQNRFSPTKASQGTCDSISYSRQFAILPLRTRTITNPCVWI